MGLGVQSGLDAHSRNDGEWGVLPYPRPLRDGAGPTRRRTGGPGFRAHGSFGVQVGCVCVCGGGRLFRLPARLAFGHLEPLKGEALRAAQGNLRKSALLIGDERGLAGLTMIGREGYNESLAPYANRLPTGSSPSCRGRPVVNLPGDDRQIPHFLEAARCDKTTPGPAAHRGLLVHGGFAEAVVLKATVPQGEGGDRLR